MDERFAGKHVLVTGGARGLGFAIARRFAQAGASVSLLDVSDTTLTAAAAALADEGFTAVPLLADVRHRTEIESAVARAEARAPIDVLVNNAGIAAERGFLAIEPHEWEHIVAVNLTGMFHVAQTVCRRMAARRRGVVINMASKNGLAGEAGYAPYNASKGGVVMLTRTMALELAHLGIRVNAVSPGYIETPLSRSIDSPDFVRGFVDRYIPLDRAGTVDDVAPLFVFLASDEARFITGEVIVVDGGQLAGQKPGRDLLDRLLR